MNQPARTHLSCTPASCRESMRLSINNDQLKAFAAKQSIPYPVLCSMPVPITALGKVPALPTTYIIDPDRKVVAGEVGLVSRQHLEDYIAGKKAEKVSANKNSSEYLLTWQ